ncbi:MAG: RNA methyltransferase [Planctomycetes bacterium]|nr:RNA methyltransferase [Planctomycetota bacterium]
MTHIEGRPSILAALQAGKRKFLEILVSRAAKPEKVEEIVRLARRRGVGVRHVATEAIERLAHGRTHGGVLAVCEARAFTPPEALLDSVRRAPEPPLLLLLDGVDDPKHLGQALRSAEALGAHAVLVRRRAWDFDETEVSRASSGAFERMDLVVFDGVHLLDRLREAGLQIVACLGNAVKTMYETDLAAPTVIVIGGEKRGISGAVRAVCSRRMSIPTRPGAATLSLTHAAAVALAEAMRQRKVRSW